MEELDSFKLLSMQTSHIKDELDVMFDKKEITEEDYNKNITSLAYEYAINGFPDDCLLMLFNVKGEYFKLGAINHFKEDEAYFCKCSLIFELLAYSGFVPYDIMATQPAGKA